MRRVATALAIALLATACGGGSDSPTQAPPVVTPGVPASMAIQAGDNQTAAAGSPLPVHPAVVVRDAKGIAVPNVAVAFSADSGGGTIQGASATTANDGIATAGTWTLGGAEGRQVVTASLPGVASVKFIATAVQPTAPLATTTIPAAGATLTVNSPGSPLNQLSVQVPAGALNSAAAFAILSRSNAGVSLVDVAPGTASVLFRGFTAPGITALGVSPVLPLITLQVTGPQSANGEVAIRIPLPAGTSGGVMVAVLDSANKPVAFLPLVASDAVSVTVTTRAFDWRMYAVSATGAAPSTDNFSSYSLTLAVFPAPAPGTQEFPVSMPLDLRTNYVIRKNNFEFFDFPTAVTTHMDAGMVLAEYGALWRFPQGIYEQNQRATGLPSSNARGIQLAAGLGKDFQAWLGAYGAEWIKFYNDRNPTSYRYYTAYAVYWALHAGYPVPLLLTDGTHTRMVLVLEWVPNGSYVVIRDPAYAAVTTTLQWTYAGLTPYVDPYDPSIRYTIPYYHPGILSALWPQLYSGLEGLAKPAPLAYQSVWPAHKYDARDVPYVSTPRGESPDSIYVVEDTTRIWYSMLNGSFANPGTLPLTAGYSLQHANVYERNGGQWVYNAGLSGPSTFLDLANGTGGAWYEKQLGINIMKLEGGTKTSWLGFYVVHLVKYVAEVTQTPAFTTSANYTVTQTRGPALPSDARYQWDFGDGTPIVMRTTKSMFLHTFPAAGPYKVTLKVLHATNDNLVLAKVVTDYPPITASISPAILQASPGNVKTLTATFGPTLPPAGAKYRWNYGDGTKPDTTALPTTTHAYTAIATYTINLDVIVDNRIVASAPAATAIVKVYPGAWRITSITLKSFTLLDPNTPERERLGMPLLDAELNHLQATPTDGMIFLDDGDLFKERAVYLQVAPQGQGANATYWVSGSFFTLLARDESIQFSHFINTGTLKSGTIDGEGYTANFGVIQDNTIIATKTATELIGTFKVTPYLWGGAREYTFVAKLVTP